MIERIVSGGQTGVDRGALRAAMEHGVACGGWCPRGRRAEDGRIPDQFPLRETVTASYRERTDRNVRDSGATLIVTRGPPRGGTALTERFARRARRPCLVVDLDVERDVARIVAWLRTTRASVLNVAGPRESQQPGIEEEARVLLGEVLEALRA